MARYFSTKAHRSELIPTYDASEGLPPDALLDESERRRLQSYRPPSGIDACVPTPPTPRWSNEELEALLAVARATVDPEERAESSERASTVPPPRIARRRPQIRRATSEVVVMTDVRARLQAASGDSRRPPR